MISAYVTCPDITLTVTPDLKLPGSGKLLWVDLGGGKQRLGGSALAHAYSQVIILFRNPGMICCKYDKAAAISVTHALWCCLLY